MCKKIERSSKRKPSSKKIMNILFFITAFLYIHWTPTTRAVVDNVPARLVNQSELEAGYIKIFGNHTRSQFWDQARAWNLEFREPRLRRFCIEAHKQAGYGEGIANMTNVKPRVLTFKNSSYLPRTVDIVMYGIHGRTNFAYRDKWYFWALKDDFWYMTAGERDDCVYYLTHANKENFEFGLIKHVCGIFIDLELHGNVTYF